MGIIARSRQNPEIRWADDAEVGGDGVADGPSSWGLCRARNRAIGVAWFMTAALTRRRISSSRLNCWMHPSPRNDRLVRLWIWCRLVDFARARARTDRFALELGEMSETEGTDLNAMEREPPIWTPPIGQISSGWQQAASLILCAALIVAGVYILSNYLRALVWALVLALSH
jgi:hypothetical protein